MTTQINFKLHEETKAQFEAQCDKKEIEMARCLRALTIAVARNEIPQDILEYFLQIEDQEYPETRGRKPASASSASFRPHSSASTISVRNRSKIIKKTKKKAA